MRKISTFLTSVFLAVTTMVFMVLFVLTYQKSKDYEEIIDQLSDSSNSFVDITIKVDALDNDLDGEIIYEDVPIANDEGVPNTLQDLLEQHPENFGLSEDTGYGKMVEEIKTDESSEWVLAVYGDCTWWALKSPEYVEAFPDTLGGDYATGEVYGDGTLNVGINSVYLTQSFTFYLVETPA